MHGQIYVLKVKFTDLPRVNLHISILYFLLLIFFFW